MSVLTAATNCRAVFFPFLLDAVCDKTQICRFLLFGNTEHRVAQESLQQISFPQTQLKHLLNKKISFFTHWDNTRSPHLEEWVIGKVWGSDLLYMHPVKPSSTTGLIILSSVWDWFWGPVGGPVWVERQGARKPKKKGSEIKVGMGKMAGGGRAEGSSGLLTPEVINKSVSSRTPMMIWAELFHLSPEVIQGYSKNGRTLCVCICVYICVCVCLSCFSVWNRLSLCLGGIIGLDQRK